MAVHLVLGKSRRRASWAHCGLGTGVALLVAAALACGARTVRGPDPGPRPLVECDGGVVAKPLDAGSCYGTCCSPKVGNNTNLTSPAAAVNALVGKWRLCSSFPNAPAGVIGIDLAAPMPWDGSEIDDAGYISVMGNLDFLVNGPEGPEPGQGFAYESGWGLYGEGSSYSMYLGGSGTQFLYSACPPQLELQVYYDAGGAAGGQTADILLVPF